MNALRHGLAAGDRADGKRWENLDSPSLESIVNRLGTIEHERLELLHNIQLSTNSPEEVSQALARLASFDRYIKRAMAKMKDTS